MIPDRPQLGVIPDCPQQLGTIPDRPQELGTISDRTQKLGTDRNRLYGQYDQVHYVQQPLLFLGHHTLDEFDENQLLVIRTVLRLTLKSL